MEPICIIIGMNGMRQVVACARDYEEVLLVMTKLKPFKRNATIHLGFRILGFRVLSLDLWNLSIYVDVRKLDFLVALTFVHYTSKSG